MMPLNKYIDHTILKPTCLVADIHKLCAEAKQYDFAAVCVPPNFVKLAKEQVAGSDVKVATVIGFPFGYSATEAKIAEIILAMAKIISAILASVALYPKGKPITVATFTSDPATCSFANFTKLGGTQTAAKSYCFASAHNL